MEQTTLKKIRLLYPGVFSLFYIFVCGKYSDSPLLFKVGDIEIRLYIIIVFFGFIYNAFDCRNIFWAPMMKKIGNNINSRMIKIAGMKEPETLTNQQKKSIMNRFYHCVDKDDTLTIKSKNVMFNGALLSSAVDTIIMSIAVLIVEGIYAFFSKSAPLGTFWLALGLIALCALSCFVLFKRHLALSNDQLDYIADFYADECSEGLSSILNNEKQ